MRTLAVGAAAVVFVAAALIVLRPGALFDRSGNLCDGSVPVWYPSEGGCSEVPSLVEHLWPPERWGAPTFCQGMCLAGMDEIQEQVRVRDEWRAAHPDAVAH